MEFLGLHCKSWKYTTVKSRQCSAGVLARLTARQIVYIVCPRIRPFLFQYIAYQKKRQRSLNSYKVGQCRKFCKPMSSSQDIELGAESAERSDEAQRRPPPPCRGFLAVTSKIVSDPDKSTTLYRRFDVLSARNLIFYQMELSEMERELDKLDEEDCRDADSEESQRSQRDWNLFVKCAKEDGRQKTRMELMTKIRKTLEKYRK